MTGAADHPERSRRVIEIEVDGECRQVALRREGDGWSAEIDGRIVEVSVVEAGGRWSMLVNPAEAGLHSPAQRASDSVESGLGGTAVESGPGGTAVESGLGGTAVESGPGGTAVESGFSRIGYDVESGPGGTAVESGFSRISYDIAFEPGAEGELIVHVNGVAIPLTVNENRRRRRQSGGDPTVGSGPRMIVAPMPGRIVKVLVKPQEQVSARQPLVVVEAMKMENELRAPRGGTVAEVRVAEGSSVEANTVLVVLR